MNYVFGVEGGGTKTTVALADLNGKIISQANSGPSNFLLITEEKASENIFHAMEECLRKSNLGFSQIKTVMLGLTGAGRANDQERMRTGFEKYCLGKNISFQKIIVDSDARISLEGAFPNRSGMILICGTGSIMFGKNEKGDIFRVGGWGRILGDEGSGYSIGNKALRSVCKSIDGRSEETLLLKLFSESFNLNSLETIINSVYKENFDIASLAPLVFEAAERGDKEAIAIIDEGVSDLFLHIKTMIKKIGVNHKIGLSFIGSILTNDTMIKRKLIERLKNELPKVIIREPEFEPINGAVFMAIDRSDKK